MKPVTDILKTLIAQHGIEIIQQPRRLKAMLADLLPHEKRLRYLLDLSLQAEIPKRLIDIQYETSSVWDAKVSSIKHYFKEEYFLEDKPIKLIFDCWVEVLPRSVKDENISSVIAGISTVLIPAGTFTMGSPLTEVGRSNNETQHQVTLSTFRMSKYAITNAQYAAFLNAKGIGRNGLYAAGAYPTQALIYTSSGSYDFGLHYNGTQWVPAAGYENSPVIYVTWYGAAEFAAYVGGTLPTEAQWEYACRAGTFTPFNTGNFLTNLQANYNWAYPYNGKTNTVTTYPGKTQPVGIYAPNAYELYDMHGNVWEWCVDWDGTYTTTVQTNPTGVATGSDRVIRGGSWHDGAQYCRSAYRDYTTPSNCSTYFGFRVVFVPYDEKINRVENLKNLIEENPVKRKYNTVISSVAKDELVTDIDGYKYKTVYRQGNQKRMEQINNKIFELQYFNKEDFREAYKKANISRFVNMQCCEHLKKLSNLPKNGKFVDVEIIKCISEKSENSGFIRMITECGKYIYLETLQRIVHNGKKETAEPRRVTRNESPLFGKFVLGGWPINPELIGNPADIVGKLYNKEFFTEKVEVVVLPYKEGGYITKEDAYNSLITTEVFKITLS